jgi:hypothetical protein
MGPPCVGQPLVQSRRAASGGSGVRGHFGELSFWCRCLTHRETRLSSRSGSAGQVVGSQRVLGAKPATEYLSLCIRESQLAYCTLSAKAPMAAARPRRIWRSLGSMGYRAVMIQSGEVDHRQIGFQARPCRQFGYRTAVLPTMLLVPVVFEEARRALQA